MLGLFYFEEGGGGGGWGVKMLQNVAKCCGSVLTCAKLKGDPEAEVWQDLDWQNTICPTKFAYFSCSTFSHYLFTVNLCLVPQIQAAVQRYILMLLCRFDFTMIEAKRPKLNHRNEKKRWI